MNATPRLTYAVITPARNEEAYLEGTIRSMIAQTCRPCRWVIVSDGSTDGTDDLVRRYADQHDWITLVRMPEHRDRHFAAKVAAFQAGYERVRDLAPDLVCNLDADITFGEDHFAFLLDRMRENPKLGVAGTPFVEAGRTYDFRYASLEHVSGACQMFRRACFEDIGGYQPIRGGAIDWLAVTTARMKGWQTRTFTERQCLHHRPIGTAGGNALSSQFKQGRKDYHAGGHPLWQVLRSLHQARRRPWIVGGACLLAGYAWAALVRAPSPIPVEVRAFHRAEQVQRLRRLLRCGRATAPPADAAG